jgi:two-component system NarL family sensor kinase
LNAAIQFKKVISERSNVYRMYRPTVVVIALILTICSAGCTTAEVDRPAGISGDTLEDYVHNAAQSLRSLDKDEARAALSDKNGPYVRGNLYLYAYDFNNTLLAHPFQQERVGTDRTNWTTPNGLRFVQAATDTARGLGGYVVYTYPPPDTARQIDEEMKNLYQVKLGYVEKVDETWWIGSGVYLSEYIDEETGYLPAEIIEMIDLTRSAVAYARENGTAAALAEISRQGGRFTRGNLYIYAYDYDGTLLAHPYLAPGMAGANLSDYVGPYGVMPVRVGAETAHSGGGFYVFGWENPAHGGEPELKLGYVLPVDRTWWVGSGLYLSDIVGRNETAAAPVGRTLPAMVDFVRGACDHADLVGKEQALRDFGDRDGAFVDGNLYLYVEDFNGTTLAHPIHPQKVGVARMNATDPHGLLLVKGLCDTAATGEGFFMFMYQDPADNLTLAPKIGYVKKAGEDWWVGSGVYLSDLVDPATGRAPAVLSDLTGTVEGAREYALSQGQDAALSAFRDPTGRFATMPYQVYAFSRTGVLLADPARPDAEGTDLSGAVGEYGVRYVVEGAAVAKAGGGYLIFTPEGGGQRLDYVLPVDDEWWVGAGVPVSALVQECL